MDQHREIFLAVGKAPVIAVQVPVGELHAAFQVGIGADGTLFMVDHDLVGCGLREDRLKLLFEIPLFVSQSDLIGEVTQMLLPVVVVYLQFEIVSHLVGVLDGDGASEA